MCLTVAGCCGLLWHVAGRPPQWVTEDATPQRGMSHNNPLHPTTRYDTFDLVRTRVRPAFNVTAREASKQLGVHVETVKRWARTGKVPARKSFPAGVWLFDQSDLDVLPVHEVKASAS